MRSATPIAYERGVDHWERMDGREGVPPIPPDLDQDLMHIRVAKELGVPVTQIRSIPLHWVGSAMQMMQWDTFEHEQRQKRSSRSKKVHGG